MVLNNTLQAFAFVTVTTTSVHVHLGLFYQINCPGKLIKLPHLVLLFPSRKGKKGWMGYTVTLSLHLSRIKPAITQNYETTLGPSVSHLNH